MLGGGWFLDDGEGFRSGKRKRVVGLAILGAGQVGVVLKLVSLDGLVLDAVRERHWSGGGGTRSSVLARPALQASWCSIKLSTLEKTRPQSQEWPRVPQVFR